MPSARQIIRSVGAADKLEELNESPEYLHNYLDVSSLKLNLHFTLFGLCSVRPGATIDRLLRS